MSREPSAGKVPAKPPARTCVSVLHKRGVSPPVRGRTGHAGFLPTARPGGCTPGMPASCLRQDRKGPSKPTPADVRQRPAQARHFAAAPGRELTAQALGRELLSGSTRRGRETAARSSTSASSPVRGRTGHAGFLPTARPERSQQSQWRGRAFSSRSGAAFRRRPRARIVQSGHGPRTCVSVPHRRERQLAAPRRESSSPVTDRLMAQRMPLMEAMLMLWSMPTPNTASPLWRSWM